MRLIQCIYNNPPYHIETSTEFRKQSIIVGYGFASINMKCYHILQFLKRLEAYLNYISQFEQSILSSNIKKTIRLKG
jgi:hypothetical protein